MFKLLAYSGIVTKVKAMSKNSINKDDYGSLSSLNTISSFISFLKTQPSYAPYFASLDEHTLHRGQIERIIHNAVYKDFEKIFRFSDIKQRKFLKIIFFRYEVNILKACLLRVFNKDDIYDLASFKGFFAVHSNLNVDALVAARTMDEFIGLLKGTEYYPLFTTMFNSHHSTLFDYEMQLDVHYFTKVWKLKDKLLKGNELKAYTICLGRQIDLLNIMWIYRSKKFYEIDSSKILSVIIPVNYKLQKEQLTQLIETSSIEDFLKVLNTTPYVLNHIGKSQGQNSLEQLYLSTMNHVYKDLGHKYPFSMAPIQCYLFLKEQEIDKLTTVLECIRYNLEPSAILQYVS